MPGRGDEPLLTASNAVVRPSRSVRAFVAPPLGGCFDCNVRPSLNRLKAELRTSLSKPCREIELNPAVLEAACSPTSTPRSLQLNVPVRLAEELRPAFDSHLMRSVERTPCRLRRLVFQAQACLFWSPVRLEGIACHASQYTVRPARHATLRAWDDVVDGQLIAARLVAAILASEVVSLEQVSPRERHHLPRQPVVMSQRHDLRHAQSNASRLDEQLTVARPQR